MSTNTDFLRFSAYSIKDLITRKLAQDTKFTDQIYEGSNLAILIDIFSYMAQCMLYSLNNAASESMFSDTQIYENINRLCKFIGYHPKGCGLIASEFVLNNTRAQFEGLIIPKYSKIDTESYDLFGKKICYSTLDSIEVNSNFDFSTLFYNGEWKLYTTVFISNGEKYQHFILTGLQSDSDKNKYIPNKGIHVYVESEDSKDFSQYTCVDQGLFTDNNVENGTTIYSNTSNIVDLRLNEEKTYELTFGNGINGSIPPKNSKIYIFYLESNGSYGLLTSGQVVNKKLQAGNSILGITSELYDKIIPKTLQETSLTNITSTTDQYPEVPIFSNIENSTSFNKEESVDDIKINAPEWFKVGNRLVTNSDYVYFMKTKNRDFIIDVVCQNNWEYISTFYRWLYNYSINGNYSKKRIEKGIDNKNYYINQNRLLRSDLRWSDAVDVNNVYLWVKMRNDSEILKDHFELDIQNIKALTQEVVFLKPIELYFTPCAEDISTALNYFNSSTNEFDPNNYSYIEITLDDNSIYTNIDISTKISQIIRQFFDENNQILGANIQLAKLSDKIYELGSIIRIRTIYNNTKTGETIIQPGLSFATWTSSVIDIGDDLIITNISRQLEQFQFPKLYNSNSIINKIRVIRKTINNINSLQY